MANEPVTTVSGNLTAEPELRFTPILREFAISEGSAARTGGSMRSQRGGWIPGFGKCPRPGESRPCPVGPDPW